MLRPISRIIPIWKNAWNGEYNASQLGKLQNI